MSDTYYLWDITPRNKASYTAKISFKVLQLVLERAGLREQKYSYFSAQHAFPAKDFSQKHESQAVQHKTLAIKNRIQHIKHFFKKNKFRKHFP